MAVTGYWLVDKSALWKLPTSVERDQWVERINSGRVRICLPTWLESAYSARSPEHFRQMRTDLLDALVLELVTPDAEALAREIMAELVERSQHRSGTSLVADVIIAAVAASSQLVLLHDDADLEGIAAITGQPLERLTA